MTEQTKRQDFATRVIHAGQSPDPSTGAIVPPIYATSTYVQESPGMHKGFEYSRTQNPTRMAFERCIADLESGIAGFAFASGLAATATVLDCLDQGAHVIAMNDLYGGTYRLFEKVRRRSAGLRVDYLDLGQIETLAGAIRPETRMIWVETPTNPLLKLADLQAVADIARRHRVLSVADNTFATPWIQRPLELGFDLVRAFRDQISGRTFGSRRGCGRGGRQRRAGRSNGFSAECGGRHRRTLRQFPSLAGPQDFGPAHGAPLPQCRIHCRLAEIASRDREGALSRLNESPST